MADSKATDRAVTGSAVEVLEASPVPIIVHEPGTGAILDANDAGEDLFGYPVEELREMAVTDFSPSVEDAREKVQAAFERTVAVGEHELGWEITRPNATTVEVNVSLRHRSIDGTPLVFAFVTDVSGIRKRERILDGLNDVATALLDAETAQEVADITTNAAEQVMQTPLASVRLRDGDQLKTAATTTRLPDDQGADFAPYAIGEGFIGETFAAGDARIFEELTPEDTEPSTTNVRSAICVPLGDHGVFTIGANAPGQFDESDLELATLLTRLTTAALDQIEREERLARRTDRLETLLNNAPVIFYELQPDGTITECRGRGLEALGLESGELVGVDVREAFAGQDELLESLDRAFDGEAFSTTLEIGGKWLETSYRPVTGEDGTVERLVGVSFDVTDVKSLERKFAALSESAIALSEQSTASDAVAEAIRISETVLDESVVLYWEADNEEETLRATEVSDEADVLAGDEDAERVHARGDPPWRVFEGGEAVTMNEFDPADAADAAELGSVILAPVGDHGLLTIGTTERHAYGERDEYLLAILAGILRTTLDRLDYESLLESSQVELERSNESLQQFAYVASHDLQEPIRMVSSYVSLLESEYGESLDEEASEYMDYAVDGARRMKEMIDALLDYSRVQTAGGDVQRVDAGKTLDTVERSLQMLLDDRDGTIERESLPAVRADPNQLSQVFQNLVSNAIEHGGEEPTVTVTGERTADGMIRFAVADDGPGVPPDQQERIFHLFEKGNREGEGTGIGLAICERITHRHGGDIWVESEPGDGSTFVFTLPAPEADATGVSAA